MKYAMTSVFACTMSFLGAAAMAEDAAEFYRGQAIQWVVPYDPGGGYDEYSRTLAPYFEKYSGARVDIVNMPGAGGMKGANEIFSAPADGLTIGILNGSGLVSNQISDAEGARYKVGDFSYLGRMTSDVRVMAVATGAPFQTLADMQSAAQPFIVGATGLGGSSYVDAVIAGSALSIPQRIVHGFDNSSDVRLAMLRGDVAAMWASLGSLNADVNSGDMRIFLQGGRVRSPLLPDVPTVFEVVEKSSDATEVMPLLNAWDALNEVGRPVAGPPGIPPDRLAFLRDAFAQAMSDPEFVKVMTDAKRGVSYLGGPEMEALARRATEIAPEVRARLGAAIRGEI